VVGLTADSNLPNMEALAQAHAYATALQSTTAYPRHLTTRTSLRALSIASYMETVRTQRMNAAPSSILRENTRADLHHLHPRLHRHHRPGPVVLAMTTC